MKKTNLFVKSTAILMSAMMLLTSSPLTTFADETLASASSDVQTEAVNEVGSTEQSGTDTAATDTTAADTAATVAATDTTAAAEPKESEIASETATAADDAAPVENTSDQAIETANTTAAAEAAVATDISSSAPASTVNNQTVFICDDAEKTVTATLSDASIIPAGCEFHVDLVTDYDTLQDVGNRLWDKAKAEDKELQNFVAYNMYFTLNEKEVEPTGDVSIKIEYKSGLSLTEENTSDKDINAFHLDESAGDTKVVDVNATVQAADATDIKQVEYNVGSFSIQTVALLSATPEASNTAENLTAQAASEDASAVQLNKSATENSDGTWTLNLEAYTTGTVTTTSTKKPSDIVLTLDTSGSMYFTMGSSIAYSALDTSKPDCYYRYTANTETTNYSYCLIYRDSKWKVLWWNRRTETYDTYNLSDVYGYKSAQYFVTRIGALKVAASNFVDTVAAECANIPASVTAKNRIAITTFAGNNGVGVSDFLDVSVAANAATLKTKIMNLTPGGGTNTAGGMKEAYNYFNTNSLKTTSGRNHAEVLFTDGEPTLHLTDNGHDGPGDSFDTTGADQAINYAYDMKTQTGIQASVFTVGIGETSDNQKSFLNYTSSNYPQATSMGVPGTKGTGNYYLSTDNPEGLNNIFQSISSSIGSTTSTLDTTTILKDVISDEFVISGNISDVKVKTYSYLGKDANGNRTWSSTATDITNSVTVAFDSSDSNNKTINVSGYDYKSHYVVDASGTVPTSGEKMVVSITVKRNPTTYGGNAISTNTTASGIYKSGETTPVKTFNVPSVNVPILYGVSATNKSIYLTQTTNANVLGSLSTVTSDSHNQTVNVNSTPDGVNNKYVNITYNVKNSTGEVVATKTVNAGATIPSGENAFDYAVSGLTENTSYTVEAVVTPSETATAGFTAAATVTKSAVTNVYVFKPTVACTDETVFYGDTTSALSGRLNTPTWSCGVTGVAAPDGTAPTLTYTLHDMSSADENSATAETATFTPDSAMNFKVTKVTIGAVDVTDETTITPSTCTNGAADHATGRSFTIHVIKGELDLTKIINSQYTGITAKNAEETFVFKVQRFATAAAGAAATETYYLTVSFDANGNLTSGSANLVGLKSGYYTVTEETSWTPKYQLVPSATADNDTTNTTEAKWIHIGNKINDAYYGVMTGTDTSLASVNPATVRFQNSLDTNWKWLSDVASVVNKFVQKATA